MTQSLVIQAPYRRIRHPELTPVIINRDSFLSRDERNNGKKEVFIFIVFIVFKINC